MLLTSDTWDHALHPAQVKREQLSEKGVLAKERSLGRFPGHVCIPLLLLLSQEPNQKSLINQNEMTC